MSALPSAGLPLLVSRAAAGSAIRDALRLFVGRGRRYSVKQLSNGTGVKDRTIEAAMLDPEDGEWRRLPPEALLSIALFLGAEFTTEWLSLAQQGAYALAGPDDTPPGAIAADTAEDAAKLTRMAADDAFEDERPALQVIGTRLSTTGARLVRMAHDGPARKAA